jgi:tetratricopeptide (TPR) repeat protein
VSKVASNAPDPIAPTPYQPIQALLRAGRNDEAIVKLCALVVTRPEDLAAKELLFDAFFQKRAWLPAFVLAEELARRQPENARLQKALIATLSNMKRYDKAIVLASRYIERHGEDLTILGVLKVAHFYIGKVDEAIRYEKRAIELRDAEACRNPTAMTMTEPSVPPSGQDVISFSLWGTAPVYSYGAMINLMLSRTVYPGWTCRFYVDASVPRACVAFLANNGSDVRKIEDEYPGVGQFQHLLVMNDPTVGRLLVRDCDSRLSAAEADLVQQWIDSGYSFHVVRGHILHDALMLSGLWAGRTDTGIDIVELMRNTQFYLRAHGEIRAGPARARPHAVAADPQPLPGPRPVLPAGRRPHGRAARSTKPFRRRLPGSRRGARRGGPPRNSKRAIAHRPNCSMKSPIARSRPRV